MNWCSWLTIPWSGYIRNDDQGISVIAAPADFIPKRYSKRTVGAKFERWVVLAGVIMVAPSAHDNSPRGAPWETRHDPVRQAADVASDRKRCLKAAS